MKLTKKKMCKKIADYYYYLAWEVRHVPFHSEYDHYMDLVWYYTYHAIEEGYQKIKRTYNYLIKKEA